MSNCFCGSPAKNLGQPSQVCVADRAIKLAFQEQYNSTGAENRILASETLDSSYFTALINQTDKSKKLYPTGTIKAFVDSREDPNTDEADGVGYLASEGNRTFVFEILEGAHPKLAEAYNSLRCKDMAVFGISISSQLIGNGSVEGALKGFKIEKGTLYAKFVPKTRETVARVMVSFTISVLEDDADISFLEYSSTATGAGYLTVDPLSFRGLVDVYFGDASSITTTGFRVPIHYIYGGDLFHAAMLKGAVIADFSLYNVTDASSVTITSVTEVDGLYYTFVIPTQTSADELRLTFSKSGFEAASTLLITIP